MYSPVPELNLLQQFDDSADGYYAPGFELRDFGSDDGGYPEAADRLRVFATATHSGSTYAIWLMDDRTDLAALPVVLLADEGGVGLVADSTREFLRVLASGWTPWGDWGGAGYSDEREEDDEEDDEDGDYHPCPANESFREWLRDRFGLEAAEDPNDVVDATESKLWDRFAAWIGPLYPDVVNVRRRP